MDKEHRVSVYDMVKELNLKRSNTRDQSKEVYIEQAETNRPSITVGRFFLKILHRIEFRSSEKQNTFFIEEVEKRC